MYLWNPIARAVQHYVHIPVSDGDYLVTNSQGAQVPLQLNPLFAPVLTIPGRQSTATQEVVFYATLPSLDYAAYTITRL